MTDKRKKFYSKPQIQQVKLVPEEAVLGGCKVADTGGGIGSTTSCTTNSCVNNGTS